MQYPRCPRPTRRHTVTTALLLLGLILSTPAWPAPIVVDTTAATAPGACTLASAIGAAQLGADVEGCQWDGEATVDLSAGTYRVAGQITVSGNVAVNGNGATLERDDVTVQHRFFRVQGQLELHQLTLDGGHQSSGRGGAVKVSTGGTFSAYACTFSNNHADWSGGALYSLGTSSVTSSTFSSNVTNRKGGAIHAEGGSLSVTRSTFVGNDGTLDGGGVIYAEIDVAIDNSTFSANSAQWGGAVYQKSGTATIVQSTFKDNVAQAIAGGSTFYLDTGATIEVGTSALVDGADDLCWGTLTSLGDNAATDASCALTALNDQQNVAIPLSDLVDHGGVTQVHAPLCDSTTGPCQSPLFERYDCDDQTAWDQRNQFPRHWSLTQPNGYPDTGARCDVGAYESSCQTVYWPVASQEQRVRLHRFQSSTSEELLDNGACYAHTLDFDDTLSGCSITWEIYGGALEVVDIVFITDQQTCAHDCFTDPDLCAQNCATSAPVGWIPASQQPAGAFQYDVPSCTPPTASFRYVVAYASSQTPQQIRHWDPRVNIDPPGGSP